MDSLNGKNYLKEFRDGFDLNLFLNMKSFAEKIRYANDKLTRLAAGSSRIIYKIDDSKVLKLAKNKKGLSQNEVEGDWYINTSHSDIIAGVIDRDENYRWIISKYAKKITPSRFKHLLGVDIRTFFVYLLNIIQYKNFPITKESMDKLENNEFATEIRNLIGNMDMPVGDFGRISSYGEIDGKLVLVDYGLTNSNYKEFYQR